MQHGSKKHVKIAEPFLHKSNRPRNTKSRLQKVKQTEMLVHFFPLAIPVCNNEPYRLELQSKLWTGISDKSRKACSATSTYNRFNTEPQLVMNIELTAEITAILDRPTCSMKQT